MKSQTPKSKIKIVEPITKNDYDTILRLIEDNIVKYITDMEYLESFSSGEILLAKEEEKVVGALLMRKPGKVHLEFKDEFLALEEYGCGKDDIGFVIYIIVDSRCQGKGIGKILVEKALAGQKEWGAKAVGVHCWQGSPGNGSQRLFESLGFESVKMHKAIWKDFSAEVGPQKYWCLVCGNPCKCDELEMVYYFPKSIK